MEVVDVAVIGGGPAGSSAAREAVERGREERLVEGAFLSRALNGWTLHLVQ